MISKISRCPTRKILRVIRTVSASLSANVVCSEAQSSRQNADKDRVLLLLQASDEDCRPQVQRHARQEEGANQDALLLVLDANQN